MIEEINDDNIDRSIWPFPSPRALKIANQAEQDAKDRLNGKTPQLDPLNSQDQEDDSDEERP